MIENLLEENLKLRDSIKKSNNDILINKSNLKQTSSDILNVKKDIVESENYALMVLYFFITNPDYLHINVQKMDLCNKELNKKQQEIIEKQIEDSKNLADWLSSDSQNQIANASQNDHSFAKRVADEIVRMSTNLSRMDESFVVISNYLLL